jgi:hypothetical protein
MWRRMDIFKFIVEINNQEYFDKKVIFFLTMIRPMIEQLVLNWINVLKKHRSNGS